MNDEAAGLIPSGPVLLRVRTLAWLSPDTQFSELEVGDKRSLQDNTSPKNRN